MSTISSVEPFVNSNFLPIENYEKEVSVVKEEKTSPSKITGAKIAKIALAVFGTLLAVAAVGTLFGGLHTVSLGIGILTIPLAIISAVAFFAMTKIKDYGDASCLAEFRKEALCQPLAKTVKEHSWQNVFQYGIPLPHDFKSLYMKEAELLKLNEVLSLYDIIQKQYIAHRNHAYEYDIPQPRIFAYKFEEETRSLTPSEIYDNYNIKTLDQLHILDHNNPKHALLISHVQDYLQITHSYQEKLRAVQEEFNSNIKLPLAQYNAVLKAAKETERMRQKYQGERFNRQFEHSVDYVRRPEDNINRGRLWGDVIVATFESRDNPSSSAYNVAQAEYIFQQQTAPFRDQRDEQIVEANTWYQNQRQHLDAEFKVKK